MSVPTQSRTTNNQSDVRPDSITATTVNNTFFPVPFTEVLSPVLLPERMSGRVAADAYHAAERYGDFLLRYVWDPGHAGRVRVYVESHPDYRGRDHSAVAAHLWPARDGIPAHICFKADYAPCTYEEAKRLAELWCDLTVRYIATGMTISDQIARQG